MITNLISIDTQSSKIKIRNCALADLRRVEEVERLSFEDPYPLSLFQRFLKEFPRGFRVATLRGVVVGYCVLVPAKEIDQSSWLIASIAIDPDYRRTRIGTQLIEDAISIARASDWSEAKQVKLQVRVNNEVAIALYSKIGFRKKSIISDYYGWGKDALEMSFEL